MQTVLQVHAWLIVGLAPEMWCLSITIFIEVCKCWKEYDIICQFNNDNWNKANYQLIEAKKILALIQVDCWLGQIQILYASSIVMFSKHILIKTNMCRWRIF
jgi:hypothetical protein